MGRGHTSPLPPSCSSVLFVADLTSHIVCVTRIDNTLVIYVVKMSSHNGPNLETEGQENKLSTISELVSMEQASSATVASMGLQPHIASVSVRDSSKIHFGPKFVKVTKNITNTEGLRARFLGLELMSTRRMRCSVAVFVCWALIVASGLGFYVANLVLHNQSRLDIDLPLPQYVWSVLKDTSRAERVSCGAAVFALLVCVILIGYFTVMSKTTPDEGEDIAPHEWYITRENWLAVPFVNNPEFATLLFQPVNLVIIHHSVSPECRRFITCASEVRNLQNYFIPKFQYDIPYNFLIGNDGRVYEGRGWGIGGAHTRLYNLCSVGIGFIGDYREERNVHTRVTAQQVLRANRLLEEGVRLGYLREDYFVVGGKDLRATESPGSNLYAEIRTWPHYDHQNRYHNMTCPEIYDLIQNTSMSMTNLTKT